MKPCPFHAPAMCTGGHPCGDTRAALAEIKGWPRAPSAWTGNTKDGRVSNRDRGAPSDFKDAAVRGARRSGLRKPLPSYTAKAAAENRARMEADQRDRTGPFSGERQAAE